MATNVEGKLHDSTRLVRYSFLKISNIFGQGLEWEAFSNVSNAH